MLQILGAFNLHVEARHDVLRAKRSLALHLGWILGIHKRYEYVLKCLLSPVPDLMNIRVLDLDASSAASV